MRKLCEDAIALLESGNSFVQATILKSSGSTPRGAGSSMLILKGGEIRGTVGGGVLEAHIIKTAEQVFQGKQAQTVSVTLDGKDAAALGAICGGSATVLVDYIGPEIRGSLDFYRSLVTALRSDARARLVTAVTEGGGTEYRRQCVLLSSGKLSGHEGFEPAVIKALEGGRGYDAYTRLDNHHVYINSIGTDGTVYIFGAGHCGEKLAPVLRPVGFGVVVIDDRAEFANEKRFPDADEILVPEAMDEPFSDIDFGADSYIVIVTRGHAHDELVLRGALKTKAGYVGMIGSKRKRETIYKNMLADGYDQKDIDRVYSPIGVDIGADTPEEIAVSITAELIKVRAERRGSEKA